METIDKILKEIDISKMETKYVDFEGMLESEFSIYEFISQPDNDIKLTYCYYHRWICTDTEVGIRVWYFENVPVCISYQPYRKSDEEFAWLNEESFKKVRDYAYSLKEEDEFHINLIDNDFLDQVLSGYDEIKHKQFEQKYIKK